MPGPISSTDLASIEADLDALRRRVDATNDPRLDNLGSRLFGALSELRRITRQGGAGHVERFGR